MTNTESARPGIESMLMVLRSHYGTLQGPHQAHAMLWVQQNRLLATVEAGNKSDMIPLMRSACRRLVAIAVMIAVDICRVGSDETALDGVFAEHARARRHHAPMRGAHEGWAVIHEEIDELWAEVKADAFKTSEGRAQMREEAIQVGAMALAFLIEVASE